VCRITREGSHFEGEKDGQRIILNFGNNVETIRNWNYLAQGHVQISELAVSKHRVLLHEL
jgi:hypothetical protein